MPEMELLAPAGTLETFFAAVESGADAIYAGLPGLNARNLARDLRVEELGAMIDHCHHLGKKLYIAANSLMLEQEIPLAAKQLAILEELNPDGLIVQDLGILRLVSHFFPGIALHASTLMAAHNSTAVNFFASLGCRRVVLARELTCKEIEQVRARCPDVELEVFIHGAMCYSFSGLCLFSSYLGGKSGLRGRCVQPCRRAYATGGQGDRKGGRKENSRYLFSMNDLSGLEVVQQLRQSGVRSLKIEGRLRSAHYVRSVVTAYRTLLDAPEGEEEGALKVAREMVEEAMSRKTSPGYFFSPQPETAISPQHSGNMGMYLGRFSTVKVVGDRQVCRFVIKKPMMDGDRLRIQLEPGGERLSFRVRELFVGGVPQEIARQGDRVSFALPEKIQFPAGGGYADVYRVDGPSAVLHQETRIHDSLRKVSSHLQAANKRVTAKAEMVIDAIGYSETPIADSNDQTGKRAGRLAWWLYTDSLKLVISDTNLRPQQYLLPFTKSLVGQAGTLKTRMGKRIRQITWALPPIIPENSLVGIQRQIHTLIRSGFRSFQLGHVSQIMLFGEEKVHLCCDYTLNLSNSQAVRLLNEMGVENCQTSLELDRQALWQLAVNIPKNTMGGGNSRFALGLTVYGKPALFTSRLAGSHLPLGKKVISPKQEDYVVRKDDGLVQTFAGRPFSLLPFQDELYSAGFDYLIVDIRGEAAGKRMLGELAERIRNTGRYAKLSTFNYLNKLA